MKTIQLSFTLLVFLLLVACKGQGPKCKYKPPTPFFTAESPDVAKHSFELKEMTSSESIDFKSGMNLTVYQSGCNELKQEYHFEVPPAPKDVASFWIALAASQFDYVSSRSISIKPVAIGLSGILMAEKDNLNLGETYDLVDMGVSLKVDKISAAARSSVIVTLGELSNENKQ